MSDNAAAARCKCGQREVPAGCDGVRWYWQRHGRDACTLELPNKRCWCGLLRSEHIDGHREDAPRPDGTSTAMTCPFCDVPQCPGRGRRQDCVGICQRQPSAYDGDMHELRGPTPPTTQELRRQLDEMQAATRPPDSTAPEPATSMLGADTLAVRRVCDEYGAGFVADIANALRGTAPERARAWRDGECVGNVHVWGKSSVHMYGPAQLADDARCMCGVMTAAQFHERVAGIGAKNEPPPATRPPDGMPGELDDDEVELVAIARRRFDAECRQGEVPPNYQLRVIGGPHVEAVWNNVEIGRSVRATREEASALAREHCFAVRMADMVEIIRRERQIETLCKAVEVLRLPAAPPTVPGEPRAKGALCWCGRVTTIRVPIPTPFCEEHARVHAPPTVPGEPPPSVRRLVAEMRKVDGYDSGIASNDAKSAAGGRIARGAVLLEAVVRDSELFAAVCFRRAEHEHSCAPASPTAPVDAAIIENARILADSVDHEFERKIRDADPPRDGGAPVDEVAVRAILEERIAWHERESRACTTNISGLQGRGTSAGRAMNEGALKVHRIAVSDLKNVRAHLDAPTSAVSELRDCTCSDVRSGDSRCRGVGSLGEGWRCVKLGRGPTAEERAEAKRLLDEYAAKMTDHLSDEAPPTFIERCLRGEIENPIVAIDDAVHAWHTGEEPESMHVYLGMTWEEYGRWVIDPYALTAILEERRSAR